MPATAAFCRQCGSAVPEEDLAQSKKELEAQAAAVADALAALSSGPKESAKASKSAFHTAAGVAASSLKDRQQLVALGLPGNLKWAALALILVAGAALGGWSVYKYMGHDDPHDTHDTHNTHKEASEDPHKDEHKDEHKDAHAPASKPGH